MLKSLTYSATSATDTLLFVTRILSKMKHAYRGNVNLRNAQGVTLQCTFRRVLRRNWRRVAMQCAKYRNTICY